MQTFAGGCYCGNLHFDMCLSKPVDIYQPRACDCDFCSKHGPAWLSDPAGSLQIQIKDQRKLRRLRQGSEQAEFLLCGQCGVLIGVCYQQDGKLFAAVNARTVTGVSFGEAMPASPKLLSASEKNERWTRLWFNEVTLQND